MPKTINARIPPHVAQKLADYCARSGATRSQTVVKALDEYLGKRAGGPDAYSLAADLIPRRGAPALRSDRVRELARKAFRGPRTG